jgi:hypothetical protein
MKKIYIYGLSGYDGVIRYVGKSYRPNVRKNEHLYEAKAGVNTYKNNWLRKLIKIGDSLVITILEECNENNWAEKEKYWINRLPNLTNLSDGGEGSTYKKYTENFSVVKEWVLHNTKNITSESKWREYVKYTILPDFIPNRPDVCYKNNGWVSWSDFLNTEKDYLSYDKLKTIVRVEGYKTGDEYRLKRDLKTMPYNPNLYYTKWGGWRSFLGTIPTVKLKKEYISFKECKIILHPLGLKTKEEFLKWRKNNKYLNIPSDPTKKYNSEWVSWGDFLNNENKTVRGKSNKFLSYSEAFIWVKENLPHITSEAKWRGATKTLPTNIPKRPDYTYRNYGWTSWGDFLN